jgi:hypothetical protein
LIRRFCGSNSSAPSAYRSRRVTCPIGISERPSSTAIRLVENELEASVIFRFSSRTRRATPLMNQLAVDPVPSPTAMPSAT